VRLVKCEDGNDIWDKEMSLRYEMRNQHHDGWRKTTSTSVTGFALLYTQLRDSRSRTELEKGSSLERANFRIALK